MRRIAAIALLLLSPGCLASRVLWRVISVPHHPRSVENKIIHPERVNARLSALWVGHSTVLVQMDDRFILTDPVFTRTVGELSPRLVEPGIEPGNLPRLAVVAVSHLHFDHLSYDSLEMLKDKIQTLVLPPGAKANMPKFSFRSEELTHWQSYEHDGLRVTAVPVRHVGGRWGIDNVWNPRAFTGYVFEYHGLSVYFGGDMVFDAPTLQATHKQFGSIDLALLPICPAEPHSFMQFAHMNPEQSIEALNVLGARKMVPIHFDTFINSDDRPGECSLRLLSEMSRRGVGEDRITILRIGEQRVLVQR
jgi:N-acyl-phosphatidylethanolamine-hydrolysing phospholipase D